MIEDGLGIQFDAGLPIPAESLRSVMLLESCCLVTAFY